MFKFLLIILIVPYTQCLKGIIAKDANYTEEGATQYSEVVDDEFNVNCPISMIARWSYITDVNNVTAETESNDAQVTYFQFQSDTAQEIQKYPYDTFEDVSLYRKFRFQKDQGPGSLSDVQLDEYQTMQSSMETLYSTATICDYYDRNKCDLLLEPDLEEIMATSTDFDELQYVWQRWREVSGRQIRDTYLDFVKLSNIAAQNDGYADTGDYWLNGYTVTDKEVSGFDANGDLGLVAISQDDFKARVDTVFQEVLENLYKPLHAYVRMKLKQTTSYANYIDSKGTLPSHILGNMWAQDWTNIASMVMPFPDQPDFDVTQSMIDNGWDIDQMFHTAEDFFESIGLYAMTDDFWRYSVTNETAWGKAIVCHASAEDMCYGPGSTDFRIKMCTSVNMGDLVTVHHEMGHIEYFMAYTNLSHVFRTSANPGFHEAIGDVIALSVSTPTHMEDILNLTSESTIVFEKSRDTNYTVDEQTDLNFLMRMALEKIAFLPFGYLIDMYRWGIFDGSTDDSNLNANWWIFRENLQGVSPPLNLKRDEGYSEEDFFDAGAKYHVPANVPYIRYFVSFIVQFQFQQRLCDEAGYVGDLFKCDIYSNTDAGALLKSALKEGFEKPWPLVLQELGGSLNMNADAITTYFEPLMTLINEELQANGETIGWTLTSDSVNVEAATLMTAMNDNLTTYLQYSVMKSWNYYTNVTDENLNEMNEASASFSTMYNYWWTNELNPFDYETITDPSLKRQYKLQQSIGTAILDEEDLNEFNTLVGNMTDKLNNKVCPYDNQICDLETEGLDIDALEILMGVVRDYDELLYYWLEWRDVSGKEMIVDYPSYVELTNVAAAMNGLDDGSVMWLEPYVEDFYSSTMFQSDIESIWTTIKPFYVKLHAYVRFKLMENNYTEYFDNDGLIPANILGNMYAQSWINIYDLVAPYPEVDLIDLTPELEDNIDDVREMFAYAEDFFTSIGLYHMSDDFEANTLYEQPSDRTVICHASAWDYYSLVTNVNDGRYRIKMCTNKNQEDFITIHHEMGHIEYYMSYTIDKPLLYRDGANPGFHEAIGDTIALSVSTPSHLELISQNLTGDTPKSKAAAAATEQDLNFLMKQALDKVSFLPFAYIIDEWRWEAFQGNFAEDTYNYEWWDKRIKYQGVKPPVDRSKNIDFDIGCKYHVPTNVPYIRYFVATILQFQFHERLCDVINYQGSVYNCDIYNYTSAGQVLYSMLSKGRSQNWQITLSDFLGDPNGAMSANSILNYFDPLIDYLDQQIEENNIPVGWDDSVVGNYISDSSEPDNRILGLSGEISSTEANGKTPTRETNSETPTTEANGKTPTRETNSETPTTESGGESSSTTKEAGGDKSTETTKSGGNMNTSPKTTVAIDGDTSTAAHTVLPPEIELGRQLKKMDENLTIYAQDAVTQTWNYYTDETNVTLEKMNEATSTFANLYKAWWFDVIQPAINDSETIENDDTRRQVQMQNSIGVAILDDQDLQMLNDIIVNMSNTMNKKVCDYDQRDCNLTTEGYGIDKLESMMATEMLEYSHLLYYWDSWREVTGDDYVDSYPQYVDLMNKAAVANNFEDSMEMWINKYTWETYMTDDFTNDIDALWWELEPLYKNLHAYVLSKLKEVKEYENFFSDDGLIPAHILGDMYAQSWLNIYPLVVPFSNVTLPDLTPVLQNESSVSEMFDMAEEFFTSIDLYPMTADFDSNSMKEQPPGKIVVCHASAMDFRSNETDNTFDGKFRIKMCTNTTEEDFITIHHEMGHIEYFMAYSDEGYPLIYRNGANPGFHEAIGDTIALSVSTTSHTQMIIDRLNGKSKSIAKVNKQRSKQKSNEASTNDDMETINYLMKRALDKVAFLPYAYILDQWRWEVFSGNITSDVYNYEWWRKRIDYQGLNPGIKRTRETNFDIGCKYHVAANVPYIRYFVATILQFQFHQKLCSIAEPELPLYECDIYENKPAGNTLKDLLMKGASSSWQDQLKLFLDDGNGEMSAQSILDYFKPLNDYLQNYIDDHDIQVGWSNSTDTDVLDDYFVSSQEISAAVPIVVGAVLAIMVCIVVIAFFMGQKKRKAAEKRKQETEFGEKVNEALEMNEKDDV